MIDVKSLKIEGTHRLAGFGSVGTVILRQSTRKKVPSLALKIVRARRTILSQVAQLFPDFGAIRVIEEFELFGVFNVSLL